MSACERSGSLCKRKRVVLTLKEKLQIIDAVNNGESRTELAEKYDIGISTVADIYKREREIRGFADTTRKVMKTSANDEMEDAVYMWYKFMRIAGNTVTGPQLCEKALVFNRKLNGDPAFKASQGWMQRFKARRGVNLDGFPRKLEGSDTPKPSDGVMLDDEDIIQRCLVAVKTEGRGGEAAAGVKCEGVGGTDGAEAHDDTQDAYLDSSTGFIRRKKRKRSIKKTTNTLEQMNKRKLALEIEQLELRNHLCRIEIFQAEKNNSLAPSVYTESLYANPALPSISEIYITNDMPQ